MVAAAPSNRAVAVAAIVAAHAAGFAAIGTGGAAPVAVRPAIVVHEIADAPLPEASPPTPTFVAVDVDIAAPLFATSDGVSDAGECRLTSALQDALAGDDDVRRALDAMPAATRSVANAVMVWDGTWTRAAALGGTARVDPVHAAVVAQIRAASPACRDATITGPRLLMVAATGRPTALAFGSGVWRWSDLLS